MEYSFKGCHFLEKDESFKMHYLIKKLQESFSFLPVIFFPVIYRKNVLENFNLSNYELFEIKDVKERDIILAPEYSNFFALEVAKKFPAGQYTQPCFRKENTQKNRKRQFYQFGIETKITEDFQMELFLLKRLRNILQELFEIHIIFNYQGNLTERNLFFNHFQRIKNQLNFCSHCQDRLEKKEKINFFKILECNCSQVMQEYAKFITPPNDSWKKLLIQESNFSFSDSLFRGIDYYHGWVFEIVASNITIGGGGFYGNGYFGFALGLDRIINIIDKLPLKFDVFVSSPCDLEKLVDTFQNNSIPIVLHIGQPKGTILNDSILIFQDFFYLFFQGKKSKFFFEKLDDIARHVKENIN